MNASAETIGRLARHQDLIGRLAGTSGVEAAKGPVAGAVQDVVDEATFILPLGGVIDVAAERQRLEREIDRLDSEIRKVDAKLNNPAFVAKAPPEVIDEQRERRADSASAKTKIADALARLAAL